MTFQRGEQAGKAASFWGKTSLCSFSVFRAWPGAVEMGPLSSEGLWRPRFSLADSVHSKDPFLFSKEDSYAKHCADPSPTGVPSRGVYGWTCSESNPIFCLLICSCRAWGASCPLQDKMSFQAPPSPQASPEVETMTYSVRQGQFTLLVLHRGLCSITQTPSGKVQSWHSRDQGKALCLAICSSDHNSKLHCFCPMSQSRHGKKNPDTLQEV